MCVVAVVPTYWYGGSVPREVCGRASFAATAGPPATRGRSREVWQNNRQRSLALPLDLTCDDVMATQPPQIEV
jgi:hypothetical protein